MRAAPGRPAWPHTSPRAFPAAPPETGHHWQQPWEPTVRAFGRPRRRPAAGGGKRVPGRERGRAQQRRPDRPHARRPPLGHASPPVWPTFRPRRGIRGAAWPLTVQTEPEGLRAPYRIVRRGQEEAAGRRRGTGAARRPHHGRRPGERGCGCGPTGGAPQRGPRRDAQPLNPLPHSLVAHCSGGPVWFLVVASPT